MAKKGHTPRLATYRPIGSPLGRRTFGHWPHTTGCHSGQKGEAGLRLQATYRPLTGHPGRPHWPPTGHKGTAIGGRPSHRPSLATYSPSPLRPIEAFGREASPHPD